MVIPRLVIRYSVLVLLMTVLLPLAALAEEAQTPQRKKIAAIVTSYHPNSHADLIVSRLLQTSTLDGNGKTYPLGLVSLYTDQVPQNDISRKLAEEYGFSIYDNIADALTLNSDSLAVDGVLLIAEHGTYPRSSTGSLQYPKRRMFEQIVKVFETGKRVAPVFIDKHLSDNWADAKWIYETAKRLEIPLMAGSSVPTAWRQPPLDVPRGSELQEVVAVSYHTLDAYGFHALEALQALVERRMGGETGIKAVQCLTGAEVWQAGEKGIFDIKLLDAAMERQQNRRQKNRTLQAAVRAPVLFTIEYSDGLRANVLTLNGAVTEWSAAWRYKNGEVASTLFQLQEERPFLHFSFLLDGITQMMQSHKPAWPVERTLMTSGALDALLVSKSFGGGRIETPHLNFSYPVDWNWQQPSVD